jgi:hypothetical protein
VPFRLALLAFIAFCLSTVVVVGAEDSAPSPEVNVAIDFVRKTRLNRNFQAIATHVAQATQTMAMLAMEHPVKIVPAFRTNLDTVTAKYQDQWDMMLAESYMEVFTADELRSLTDEQQQSPYFAKLKSEMGTVGALMQQRAEPLLAKAVAETLAHTVEKLGLGATK